MSADFDQLVDTDDLGPDVVARMRRVHDLLLAAGPPAELPARLAQPPEVDGATVIPFPTRSRRPGLVLVAATVAAACFGGGYVLAHQARPGASAIDTVRIVPLKGEQNSFASLASASIRVGAGDADGNSPVQLSVSGLPQTHDVRYYLMLTRNNGKPGTVCGTFVVGKGGTATVSFTVPYRISNTTHWVVTETAPGVQYPGHVVMTTS